MSRLSTSLPKYRKYKASGQVIVNLSEDLALFRRVLGHVFVFKSFAYYVQCVSPSLESPLMLVVSCCFLG